MLLALMDWQAWGWLAWASALLILASLMALVGLLFKRLGFKWPELIAAWVVLAILAVKVIFILVL